MIGGRVYDKWRFYLLQNGKRILEEDIIIGIYTEKTSSILGENYSKNKRFVCRFNDFCEMLPFDVNDISGDIEIVFTQTSSKAVYIKSIYIEYVA